MVDGEKGTVELVTTTDTWLAQGLDEIPQVNVSKLLPNFPGNRWGLAACLIYAQETGAEYLKHIPIVALFRARNREESLRTAGLLQSTRWTLEGLQPGFLEEKGRYRIVPQGSSQYGEALRSAAGDTPRLGGETTERQDLRS